MNSGDLISYDIFISYAHADDFDGAVTNIYEHLTKMGLRCFFDEEHIYGGEQYRDVEKVAILQSQKVLFVFSKNCYESHKLRDEINFELKCAYDIGKTIVPFVIDGTNPNSIVYLKGTSAVYVKKSTCYPYQKLLKSICKGITTVGHLFDEGIANFSSTELAAILGDTTAQIKMGDYFQFGKRLEVDYKKAIEWFKKAAEQHDESSYSKLGECYLKQITPFLTRRHKFDDIPPLALTTPYLRELLEIRKTAKNSEKYFRKAALSSKEDYNGLFDLFELELWGSGNSDDALGLRLNDLFPDEETYRAFESLTPNSSTCSHYRFCRLMYRLSHINGLQHKDDKISITIDETNTDDWEVAPEVIKASQIALRILQNWSDAGEINARLFLASAYYWQQPESCVVKHFNRQENIEKAVNQLNLAYEENKDDIFRYNFREYDLYDVENDSERLSTRLLHQDSPNPVGLQLGLHRSMMSSAIEMDEWEDNIKSYGWPQSKQFYLLGMGALRVNLSFAAKWLTLANKSGESRAERILADFYAENLSIYICGKETITGAINNIFDQVELGASSCDPFLDAQAEEYKKKGYSLRQVSKTTLVDLFEKNMSRAFKMYLDLNDKFNMGRCYYWGIGASENKDLALSFGYGETSAEKEGDDFREWIKAIEAVKRERADDEAWADAQNGWIDDLEEDVPFSTMNDEERKEEIEHIKRMREKYEVKTQNWRKQFPDLPCPYDYIAKIYKDSEYN